MTIRIYNSLTKQKEEFKPLDPLGKEVKMYVCGPTVYDEPHLGHLRSAYVFDLMRHYLEFSGYRVKFVRNVTDVDDKIIEKARESEPADLLAEVQKVSEKYWRLYKDDLKALGIQEPTVEPTATGHIPDMQWLIQKLLESGKAYVSDGDVYFDVKQFQGYGKLSHQDKEAILQNVRIQKNEKKRDVLDFTLWKKVKEGEPFWDFEVKGANLKGRPGWHIECSAMSMKYLGESFDIHGGGRDLIFPHHENEIAQSESVTSSPFARYWIHHGLITIGEQKMSKSIKNFITLRGVCDDDPVFGAEILKLVFLGTHYTAPLDYTPGRVKMERQVWKRFLDFFEHTRVLEKSGAKIAEKSVTEIHRSFREAMDNDFNTPDVLTRMHHLMHETYKSADPVALVTAAAAIRNFGSEVFGIVFDQNVDASASKPEIEKAINERAAARRDKDFKKADEIRNRLLGDRNIELRDLSDGRTTWRVRL